MIHTQFKEIYTSFLEVSKNTILFDKMRQSLPAALLYFTGFVIGIKTDFQCGKLPPGTFPSKDKDQKLFPPWSVTISGIQGDLTIPGVIVAPKIVMASAFHFVIHGEMFIRRNRIFKATVGEHPWARSGNHTRIIEITHLTQHPKYFQGNHFLNTRNGQVLFHLEEAINISTLVQPVCLPSEKLIAQLVKPHGINPLIHTGWDDEFPDAIFKEYVVETEKMCQEQWECYFSKFVYENRFCATVSIDNKNSTKCINQEVSTVRQIEDTFYLVGRTIPGVYSGQLFCNQDVFFFDLFNEYTYSWIRNSIRCGSENFACGTGECIPLFQLCNRWDECGDGSDERADFCKFLYKCAQGEFYCGAGGDDSCIPDSKVNDGIIDCSNGEDEFYYPITTPKIAVGIILVALTLTIAGIGLVMGHCKNRRRSYANIENGTEALIADDELSELTNNYQGISPPWKSRRNLVCIKHIENGGYGQVYKAIDLKGFLKTVYAIKCVNIRFTLNCYSFPSGLSATSDKLLMIAVKALCNEMQVLSDLRSEYVVGYEDCWAEAEDTSRNFLNQEGLIKYIQKLFKERPSHSFPTPSELPKSNMFIQMEYCHFTLKKYLESKNGSQDFMQIAKDIVSGLKYVHSKRYVHLDLKPGNIFCKKIGPENEFTWKIGDFGLAVQLLKEQNVCINRGGVGTPLYRSPEMMNGSSYGMKTDLFSLGLVFVELIQQVGTKFNKVETFDEILKLIHDNDGRMQYLVQKVSIGKYEGFLRIVNQLLSGDPNLRPCSEKLLELLQ